MKQLMLSLSLLSLSVMADVKVGDHALVTCGNHDSLIAVEIERIRTATTIGRTIVSGSAVRLRSEYKHFCEDHHQDSFDKYEILSDGLQIYDLGIIRLASNKPLIKIDHYNGYASGQIVTFPWINKVWNKNNEIVKEEIREANAEVIEVYTNGYAMIKDLKYYGIRGGQDEELNEWNTTYINIKYLRPHQVPESNQEFLDTYQVGDLVKFYDDSPHGHNLIKFLEGEITEIEYRYDNDSIEVTIENTLERPQRIEQRNWPSTVVYRFNDSRGWRDNYQRLAHKNVGEENTEQELEVMKEQIIQIKNRQSQPQQQR